MLAIIQELLDELSSFLHLFAENNHLPSCVLRSSYPIFSSNKLCSNENNSVLVLNWELKSSEKQNFDIRLSFNSFQLKAWWNVLSPLLCDHIKSMQFQSNFVISNVIFMQKIRSVDILLDRKSVINSLLSALSPPDSTLSTEQKPTVIIIQVNSQNTQNYFAHKRLCLVTAIVENLLPNFGISNLKPANVFEDFAASFSNNSDLLIKYENILNQSFSETEIDNPKLKKTFLEYSCLFESYLNRLDLSNSQSSVVVILVVPESEFTRIQVVTDCLDLSEEMPRTRILFKLVKVAGVSAEEVKNITSFEAYKEILRKESITEDISADNLDTIVQTMVTFALLTPKLNSPISKLVHFRNESIFVQYNIARLKSIIDKYDREYSTTFGPVNSDVSFGLLTNEHEWNLTLINLLRMQQLNRTLHDQLLQGNHFTEFECNKIVDHLRKMSHAFSLYYRNVKILTEPMPHLIGQIKTRVALCETLLKQLSFYFLLFGIETAERM